jgi:hypothetical protein
MLNLMMHNLMASGKGLRSFRGMVLGCVLGITLWLFAPPAWAMTTIQLYDLDYQSCPTELSEGAVTSGSSSAANCFIVIGKANNPSGETVYDADVFGRIYDVNHNNVLPNRTRLGSLEEVPPGESDFELRISVAANLPTPLQLENFKARGFAARVKPLLPNY